MKKLHYIALATLVAALALSFGACKKAEEEGTGETAAGVSGTMQVKGSDTLLMLSQRWAEAFMEVNPEAVIQVTGGGSGVGIKALIEGTTDVANASRPIKDKEKEEAAGKGIEVVEIPVAVDGICFIVNPANPATEATIDELGDIYRGKTKDWGALGGSGNIMCYGRQSTSGTYDFVKKNVLNKDDYRSDIQEMQGNSLLCDSVAKDEMGIAYVGYGYAAKRDDVKILAVKKDADSPAIKPDNASVGSMEYPVSRYLFNYVNGKPDGVAGAFIKFALSEEGQKIVEEVEYVALPSDTLSESRTLVE
ncbi:MAG: PstS family phosphate ABC transporter substrate-binding protein [Candidatus Zixiibacteriota bacterium]|jgi:phosphate transport system substrate-binding protein